jgi:hypothetical protein
MDAVSAAGVEPDEAGLEALRAGADVLLYPQDIQRTRASLREALDSGELAADRVGAAAERIETAARDARLALDVPTPTPARLQALELATASIVVLSGEPRLPADRLGLAVVDDDTTGAAGSPPAEIARPGAGRARRDTFAAELRGRGIEVEELAAGSGSGRSDAVDGRADVPADLVAVFSDVRAWKGRAGLADATLERLDHWLRRSPEATVVVFGHRRLADSLPVDASAVVCAWSGDPLMQEAVAARLAAWGD